MIHRAVLDSNVWVSALISPNGNCARIVREIFSGGLDGIISPYILGEIDRVLSSRPLNERYGISEVDALEYLSLIRSRLNIVSPAEIGVDVRDPDDLPILGTAIAGRASLLVTGDRDLLDDMKLKQWMREQSVEIVSPGEFNI